MWLVSVFCSSAVETAVVVPERCLIAGMVGTEAFDPLGVEGNLPGIAVRFALLRADLFLVLRVSVLLARQGKPHETRTARWMAGPAAARWHGQGLACTRPWRRPVPSETMIFSFQPPFSPTRLMAPPGHFGQHAVEILLNQAGANGPGRTGRRSRRPWGNPRRQPW